MIVARSRKTKNSNTLHIPDLSKVEARAVLPEGKYLFEVVGIDEDEGDAGPYFKWTFAVVGGKFADKKAKPYITSLSDDSLWNLRGLLEALGVDIPEGPQDIDKDELIGKQCYSEIVHEDYNGRTQSNISGTFVADDDDGDKDDDKKGKKDKKKDKDEDVKYTQEAIDDMDEEELEDLVKEHKLKVDLEDHKSIRKKRNAVFDALEKKDLIEEE